MDTEAILDLARELSRDAFVARFSTLFFAVKQTGRQPIGFTTAVVEFDSPELKKPIPLGWDVFPIEKAPGNPYPERISIGRARNCDVVMRDATVSKLHAHLKVRPGGYDLVDLDSPNGTHVNGKALKPHEPFPVKPGDKVEFGTVVAELVDAGRLYDLIEFA